MGFGDRKIFIVLLVCTLVFINHVSAPLRESKPIGYGSLQQIDMKGKMIGKYASSADLTVTNDKRFSQNRKKYTIEDVKSFITQAPKDKSKEYDLCDLFEGKSHFFYRDCLFYTDIKNLEIIVNNLPSLFQKFPEFLFTRYMDLRGTDGRTSLDSRYKESKEIMEVILNTVEAVDRDKETIHKTVIGVFDEIHNLLKQEKESFVKRVNTLNKAIVKGGDIYRICITDNEFSNSNRLVLNIIELISKSIKKLTPLKGISYHSEIKADQESRASQDMYVYFYNLSVEVKEELRYEKLISMPLTKQQLEDMREKFIEEVKNICREKLEEVKQMVLEIFKKKEMIDVKKREFTERLEALSQKIHELEEMRMEKEKAFLKAVVEKIDAAEELSSYKDKIKSIGDVLKTSGKRLDELYKNLMRT